MADTRMYANLGRDENRKFGHFGLGRKVSNRSSLVLNGEASSWSSPSSSREFPKPITGWSRLKMSTQSGEPRSPTIERGSTMAITPAIIPVLQSDQIAKIGRMKIKAVHMRTSYLGTEISRPCSEHGLSITRELAFGKKRESISAASTRRDTILETVPEWACLGRLALMGAVFLLVCLVYVLKLKQNELDRRLRTGNSIDTWVADIPLSNSTLIARLS